jgi:tRNA threonylcarbamoyladenosine biosynthesis protein TsaB
VLVLSLDTTTRRGSVAVLRDASVLTEVSGDPAITHGQRLPRDIDRALGEAGVRLDDVELLAVAVGPGSFTGLRVGIAAMQGLAFARGLLIVPVSTLEVLARHAADEGMDAAAIAPWIDAQRGVVFASLYDGSASTVLAPPTSATPQETLRAWARHVDRGPIVFTGDAAVRYRDVVQSTLGVRARILEPVPLLAAPLARIAARETSRAVRPHAIVPVYVRRPDAELAQERRARA